MTVKPGLLDVNVLLALAWPKHQNHARASAWFAREAKRGWATCPLTEVGFIRISANPAYTPSAATPANAARMLADITRHECHGFWTGIRPCDPLHFGNARGHRQVTDAYLVGMARHHHGRLVTFDSGATQHAKSPDDVFVIA